MMDKAFVILGEASESEDDEKVVLSVMKSKDVSSRAPENKGVIVAGEASESESETEETFREAFFARSGAIHNDVDEEQEPSIQYDTLLHKKLRECNQSLHKDILNQSRHGLNQAIRAVNTCNQQLVITQVQVQDATSALGAAYLNTAKLSDSLNALLSTPYIPDINIS